MLNLELRALDKAPLQKQLRFTPYIQIEVCVKNFIKHLQVTEIIGDEFSPENIMKYFYFNGKEIDKQKFFRDYNFHDGDKIIVSDHKINIKKKRKESTVKLIIQDLDNSNPQSDKQLPIETFPQQDDNDNEIIKEPNIPTKKKKTWIYILIISLICLIIAIILLVVLVILKKKKKLLLHLMKKI